jgi:hypothetical protein
MKKLFPIFLMIFMFSKTEAQQIMDLYPGKVPNSKINKDYVEKSDTSKEDWKTRISKVSKPQLLFWL